MSTGMLAKLKVAVAMARNSRVILLDEPLNGIDIIAREQVMNTITGYNNEDKIIIVSSHLVDELGEEVSDKTRARITHMPTENYFYNYMRIKDIASFYKDFYNDFDEDRMYGLLDRRNYILMAR